MIEPIRTTAERCRELREKHGIGLHEARRMAVRELTREAIEQAQTIDDLKIILITLLEGIR